jgi:hypothetical protein
MACNQCTPCTNCTPPTPVSTSCEECADIISSSCVYYKGSYGNNLGLAANFRFNEFAEKVMYRFSKLPASLGTQSYLINTFTVDDVAVNEPNFTINQNTGGDETTNINLSLDLRPHFAIVKLNSTNNIAINSNTGAIIPFASTIATNKHIVNLGTNKITPDTNQSNGPRTGYQKLSGNISFSPNASGVATIQIKKDTTLLSEAKVNVLSGEYASVSVNAYDHYDTLGINALYHMYIKFDDVDSDYNTTIDVVDGTFEVKEYGF